MIAVVENPLLWISALGAFMLHVAARTRGRQPISLFQVMNLDVGKSTGHPLVILGDMLISSALAGSVVFALSQPTTVQQAVVAGLGATGLLEAASKDH